MNAPAQGTLWRRHDPVYTRVPPSLDLDRVLRSLAAQKNLTAWSCRGAFTAAEYRAWLLAQQEDV